MILEPFYFGPNNTCFGHYSPAEGFPQDKSVLIVPSIFGEALRAHRVTREVAKSLASQGYDVLRFDFDGDGNSSSDTKNITVQDWLQNIQDAYIELVKRSKYSTVSIFTLRFGAGLSLIALKEYAFQSIVLWDPILSTKEMYETFIGPKPTTQINNITPSKNPFTPVPKLNGFFELGVEKDFATGFLQIDKITQPKCNVQIIATDNYTEAQGKNFNAHICKVKYYCDWGKKDLPIIFAPKLTSTICEYL